MKETDFCLCGNNDAYQLCVTAQLISALVFAMRLEQFRFFLHPKFQDSSHLL